MRSTTTTMLELLLLQLLASLGSSSQPLGSNSRLCKTITITNREYAGKHWSNSRLHAELSAKVAGCQYVYGDLEILDLGAHDLRLQVPFDDAFRGLETDFLDSIVEISGRLFIKHVNLTRITLRNLRTIRGYNHKNVSPFYSMQVSQMRFPIQLELPKLSAILQGSVSMSGQVHSDLYCHLTRSVNWTSLFQNPALQKFIDGASKYKSACSSVLNCSSSCHTEWSGRQLCWSNGKNGCQSFNGCLQRPCRNCYRHPQTSTEECCNTDCLGGCSDRPDGCFTCREVIQDGICKDKCSLKSDPNPGTNSSMKRVGHICVNKCEMPFLTSSNEEHCLSECPRTEYPYQGVCKKCTQSPCKSCTITCRPFITDDEAKKLKNENCTTGLIKDAVCVLGNDVSKAGVMALESLEILYGNFFITQTAIDGHNLGFLKNIKFVSGEFYIKWLNATYLGLAKLKYAKPLMILLVSGLCKAWFPSNRIHEITNVTKEFKIFVREIRFDNSSEVCRNAACDPQCRDECWGPGPDMCVACRSFEVDGVCYATCKHAGRYQLGTLCLPCHSECDGGCSGPSASECKRCRNLKEDGKCVASCSRERRPSLMGVCYSVATARLFAVGIGVGLLILLLLLLLPLAYLHYRKRMRKYEMVDLDEYLKDPSNPSDMAKLLIVNDDDVVKQKEIGSGAFGTVYKGILRSSTNKGVRELPVAIKVLRGHSPKLGQELLNEASVLARVQHPCCIRLVALCLTQEPQLITALMPRGCLLEFLRTHHNQIGAERMLRWGLQVAEGMEYLESLGIVHRDLAARNVLLQSPDQVRITDFGLARLLNLSEGEFVQTAGLLPVKWLGVECFESGLFSHKSDVWSYGVLLWEICTFGESPYNPYGIRSVEDITGLLKKGIRLNQPDICSIDFYNILLSCWLPQPESRPSFRDLVDTMTECLNIPSKYIAQGYSIADPEMGTDDAFGDVNEMSLSSLAQKSGGDRRFVCSHDKHGLELNAYISDPTSRYAPQLRHPPVGPVSSSDTSESSKLLCGQFSVQSEPDDYLTPTSPSGVNGSSDAAEGSNGVLDDYLTPKKA